jgi:hypothetical protein
MHAVTVMACTYDMLGSNLSQDIEYQTTLVYRSLS